MNDDSSRSEKYVAQMIETLFKREGERGRGEKQITSENYGK